MTKKSKTSSDSKGSGGGRLIVWTLGIVSFVLLAYLLAQVVHQFVAPSPASRLILIQDVPLPSGLGAASPGHTNPLDPGISQNFDHFDFQAYDEATHQLFIAHSGPNPDLLAQEKPPVQFDPKFDGHIIIYNTQKEQITGRVDIPQVAGVVDVPQLSKVFAADAQDNIIYDIDVHTLKATPIALPDNEGPDAISYDPDHQLLFVSDPGSPPNQNTQNVLRSNENVAVIDPVHDKFIKLINLGNVPLLPGENVTSGPHAPKVPVVAGNIPLYGHDVGHNRYDTGLHMLFVTSTVLPDGNNVDPFLLPPSGSGEFFEIDPVTFAIVKEIDLPATCSTPHGLAIDSQQHVGFIACTDFSNPPQSLFENLVRVNLTTMTVIPTNPVDAKLESGPDIVVIDTTQNLLFVGCASGISIFDEKAGEFHKLGDVVLGKQTHTIALDDDVQTHELYVFLPTFIGGRPVLRVARYNPTGSIRDLV
jgi:DNA-binding beta-propeller fold protein YncE